MKILMQLDNDRLVSSFDVFTAYTAGVDHVLSFGGVGLEDLQKLVHGAIFTRSGEDLKNSAIFISGTSVPMGEAILKTICEEIFFPGRRVSIMADPNGSNTTSAAAVLKIRNKVPLEGKRAVILAGSGPVGIRTAALLAREKCHVTVTSRNLERAQAASALVKERFNLDVTPVETRDRAGLERALRDAQVILGAGAAGVELIPEELWANNPHIMVVADTNATPPLGISGVDPFDDGILRHKKICFGALGIGGLKRAIHIAAIIRLFERNDLVLDIEEMFDLGIELLAQP